MSKSKGLFRLSVNRGLTFTEEHQFFWNQGIIMPEDWYTNGIYLVFRTESMMVGDCNKAPEMIKYKS